MAWEWAIPAAIGAGTAAIGAFASNRAANTAADASREAADTQMQMFQQNREDLAPFRQAGLRGLTAFEGTLGPTFQTSPGYQFAMDEGRRAIDASASARGMLNSGARLRELTRFGQGMANQEFGNYQNRLAALAGIGQTATGQGAQLGAQTAQGVAQTQMAGGQAQAQGITGGVNAALAGINQGVGLYGMMNPGGWGNVARPAGT